MNWWLNSWSHLCFCHFCLHTSVWLDLGVELHAYFFLIIWYLLLKNCAFLFIFRKFVSPPSYGFGCSVYSPMIVRFKGEPSCFCFCFSFKIFENVNYSYNVNCRNHTIFRKSSNMSMIFIHIVWKHTFIGKRVFAGNYCFEQKYVVLFLFLGCLLNINFTMLKADLMKMYKWDCTNSHELTTFFYSEISFLFFCNFCTFLFNNH